jgi:membrane protein implicated in regulation of membrane protease activity
MLDFILVGRSPLGSAIRAALLGVVVTIFWRLFFSQTWQLFVVSLLTVLIAVIAAHWISRRDDAWKPGYSGDSDGGGPPPGAGPDG